MHHPEGDASLRVSNLQLHRSDEDAPLHLALQPDDDAHDALADLFLGSAQPRTRVTIAEEPARFKRKSPSPLASATVEAIRRDTDSPSPRPAEALEDPAHSATASQGPSPWLEAVILGHLPVRAPIWVKQYAAYRARSLGGTVGLIRVRGGVAQAELVGEPAKHPLASERALASLASASACIVHVEELDEPALAKLGLLDAVTLLSGADEAAVVACYRALRSLASAPEHPRLRVAWMGAYPESAQRAMDRLARTCEAFLSTPLEAAGVIRQVDSGRTVQLAPIELPDGIDGTLEAIVALRETQASDAESTSPTRTPAAFAREPDTDPYPQIELDEAARLGAAATPERVAVGFGKADDEAAPESRDTVSTIAGMTALPLRCPDAPGVEFASDEHARIWLLSGSFGDAPIDESVRDLTVARSWAIKHAELLALALAGRALAPGEEGPPARLITDRPRLARAIVGGEFEVCAAGLVTVAGKTGWACLPL